MNCRRMSLSISVTPSSMLSKAVCITCRVRSISAVRSRTSLNRRSVSMAITAWSANVDISSICAGVNGIGLSRVSASTPIGSPSRISGTPSMARYSLNRRGPDQSYSGSACTSGM